MIEQRTPEEWVAEIRGQNLDTRSDKELEQMLAMHECKISPVERELHWLTKYPDSLRRQLEEAAEAEGREITSEEVKEEVQSQIAYYQWKTNKLKSVVALIGKEKELRELKLVERV